MRAHLVEMAPPGLDHDLRFRPRAKPFQGQALVAEFAVEALGRAVLPGLARLDQRRLDALVQHPFESHSGAENGAARFRALASGTSRWFPDMEGYLAAGFYAAYRVTIRITRTRT